MSDLWYINEKYSYGYHIGKLPLLSDTIDYIIKDTPFTAIQIYLSNSRSSDSPKVNVDDILKTRKLVKMYGLDVFAHGCLLYNLCGAPNHSIDPKFDYNISNVSKNLPIELDIIAAIGGIGVVVHPNSCHDINKGLKTASKIIEHILTKDIPSTTLLSKALNMPIAKFKKLRRVIIENSAHEGGKRGWNLEELSKIINGVPSHLKDQVSVCIDTAHAYGAGIYDFGIPSDIHKFYKDFEKEVGLSYLKVFHINDSRISTEKANNAYFGSCKDRHANLGLGYIFDERDPSRFDTLSIFFKEAFSRNISLIGEPPCDLEGELCDWDIVSEQLQKKDIHLYSIL